MGRPSFDLEDRAGGVAIGIDEAGRGCLAGPVVAAAAWINRAEFEPGLLARINDSKKLSRPRREGVYAALKALPESVFKCAFARIEAEEIDRINILRAALKAMKEAAEKLGIAWDVALVDGNALPDIPRARAVVKGDAKSYSIAAASIVAKCEKDFALDEIAKLYPLYGFEKNAGYGTAEHMAALAAHGACPEHRKSYAPIKNLAQGAARR